MVLWPERHIQTLIIEIDKESLVDYKLNLVIQMQILRIRIIDILWMIISMEQ